MADLMQAPQYSCGGQPGEGENHARALTQRDMQDVAAYYASLGPQPYPPKLPTRDSSLRTEGRDIAMKGFPDKEVLPCVSRHGASGRGRPPLFPFIGGQYESYLEYQLHQFKSRQRGGSSPPS
ncbi:MAG TPA: hypothetical protein VFY39_17050 [Gammaproteobacteria bacterium]|nr:hypothetical protein [Gammaproteobacteria bacterium]